MLLLLARTGIALSLVLELLASSARGASAPYFDNFDGYPSGSQPANFTGTLANGWVISNPTGSSGRYLSSISSTPVPKYAYYEVSLDNVAGRNFTVSTKFTAAAYTQGPILDASVSLIALGSSDPPVYPQYYSLEYVVASPLRPGTITPQGGTSSWEGPWMSTLFDSGQGFTMSLHGEYVAGTLFLTATLSNGVDTLTFHGIDPTPQSGPYFGYSDSVSGTALRYAQLQVSYDDFSVTVAPESAQFGNLSTRINVGLADNVAIGGFVITGTSPKRILLRGVKPYGAGALPGGLDDPTLELYGQNGISLATNDNWKDTQRSEIEQTGLQPSRDLDSAIVTTVAPGDYTAILRGKAGTTGLGLIEIYDLTQGDGPKLGNLSTRGVVGMGDNVMIGGVIVLGNMPARVLVRALGPSLQSFGLVSLADPVLELHDSNGAMFASNDNWAATQRTEIEATGLAPTNAAESAIVMDLLPTNYTAIVRGKDNATGIAIVELYHLN